ncbi:hypothetical protein [Exiguobacterium sp.]|uniref:hypothetical protein n=1 Tax=Exiguobacterium sp. TaxID=44751 RepID=UPI0028A133BA|nr:hypothetical protein [Exiguobacterium sp.]
MAERFTFKVDYAPNGMPIVNEEEMFDYIAYCTDLDIEKVKAVDEAMTAYLTKLGLAGEHEAP